MATTEGTPPTDPSAYIAQHLQHFSTTSTASIAQAQIGYVYGLTWLCAVLAVVLVLLWFTDGRAMFRMSPPMNTRRRLALWWSCVWRRWILWTVLVTGSCTLPALLFFHAVTHGEPAAMPFPWTLIQFYVHWWDPFLPLAAFLLFRTLIPILLLLLLAAPLTGYVTKHAFAAHALITRGSLTFMQTTLLGLTTCFWSVLGAIVVNVIVPPALLRFLPLLQLLVLVPWGMYVVLPRQARRIARANASAGTMADTPAG
ncbi:hypothetical protein [Paraburkholderia phosphatilytica]|uniref:hypothetical protein n=1 Tax=Paraburkholderia phosphatilytica TaxID=2282883 RepID=UPI000E5106D2|nr:hypothetical protein [Paraburkholderia phosphatilytica]